MQTMTSVEKMEKLGTSLVEIHASFLTKYQMHAIQPPSLLIPIKYVM
jgi:hypothetical protein